MKKWKAPNLWENGQVSWIRGLMVVGFRYIPKVYMPKETEMVKSKKLIIGTPISTINFMEG